MPSANGYTLAEYKGAKPLNCTYQIHRLATMMVQRGEKPNINDPVMAREIEKEQNERLKITPKNVGKALLKIATISYTISGAIDMILIGINNMAKVEGIKEATERARRCKSKVCGSNRR
jgi:hypothetical protein